MTSEQAAASMKNVSVSSGTMRDSDLIKAFHATLMKLNTPKALNIASEYPELYMLADQDTDNFWYPNSVAWLFDDLFIALEECAPDGYRFDSHPNDGSDYGFWQVDDSA